MGQASHHCHLRGRVCSDGSYDIRKWICAFSFTLYSCDDLRCAVYCLHCHQHAKASIMGLSTTMDLVHEDTVLFPGGPPPHPYHPDASLCEQSILIMLHKFLNSIFLHEDEPTGNPLHGHHPIPIRTKDPLLQWSGDRILPTMMLHIDKKLNSIIDKSFIFVQVALCCVHQHLALLLRIMEKHLAPHSFWDVLTLGVEPQACQLVAVRLQCRFLVRPVELYAH
jgi:hypothetical protein